MVKKSQNHSAESEETHKGYMWKTPSCLRSTKIKIEDPEDAEYVDTKTSPKNKHRDILLSFKYLQDELVYTMYMYPTDKYPVRSSKSNQYIMVVC